MCETLYTPFGIFRSYDVFNNMGTVFGLGIFLVILWKKKSSWQQFLSGVLALGVIMVIGGFAFPCPLSGGGICAESSL